MSTQTPTKAAETQREIKLLREIVSAQDALLVAYRLGDQRMGARASERTSRAKHALRSWQQKNAQERL